MPEGGGQRRDRLISFISKCMRLSLTFVYHMASPALHLHRKRNLNETYRNREFPLLRNADPGKPRKRGGAAEQSRSSNVPSKGHATPCKKDPQSERRNHCTEDGSIDKQLTSLQYLQRNTATVSYSVRSLA